MTKYIVKIITQSSSTEGSGNSGGSGGAFSSKLVLEKDGVVILDNPSITAIADFLQKEFRMPVVEIKTSHTEVWWKNPADSKYIFDKEGKICKCNSHHSNCKCEKGILHG